MTKKNRSMSSDAFALLGAEAVPGTEPARAKPHRRERRAKSRGLSAWLLSALLVALLALPALFPGTFLRQAFIAFGDSDIGTAHSTNGRQQEQPVLKSGRRI